MSCMYKPRPYTYLIYYNTTSISVSYAVILKTLLCSCKTLLQYQRVVQQRNTEFAFQHLKEICWKIQLTSEERSRQRHIIAFATTTKRFQKSHYQIFARYTRTSNAGPPI